MISAVPGLSCRKPHGAFYVMMNIRGITGKRWGRVGDSPLPGAGCYANNATAAVA